MGERAGSERSATWEVEMAIRKKAKSKKSVRSSSRAKGGAQNARSGPQQLRARLRKKVDARVGEVTKLARSLNAQGLAPDDVASRVRAELAGLGGHVTDDVLRLALGPIWIRTGGEV
jgi:hypothetical protein